MSPENRKLAAALCISIIGAIPTYIAFAVSGLCENSDDCGTAKLEVVIPGFALLGLAGVLVALVFAIRGHRTGAIASSLVAAVGYAGFAVMLAEATGHDLI